MKRAIAAALIAVSLAGCSANEYDPGVRIDRNIDMPPYTAEIDACFDQAHSYSAYEECSREWSNSK